MWCRMWNTFQVILLCVFVNMSVCLVDELIDKGKWKTNNIMKCPDDAKYPVRIDVKRRKLNRTHDGFSGRIDVPFQVTKNNLGVYVEICKKVDGGCKTVQIIQENSLCDFLNKYSKDGFERALTMAGLDPPNCPIPKGPLELSDFIIDYEELPEEGMLGEFQAFTYIVQGMKRLSCMICDVTFSNKET